MPRSAEKLRSDALRIWQAGVDAVRSDVLVRRALSVEGSTLVVGDELQGLSQALFVAGTPSAVLTLWNVNDRSTSVLMAGEGEARGVYAHLMGGEMKAEALRQAQLLLLRDPLYRHPYYWAPFVLYGDWK